MFEEYKVGLEKKSLWIDLRARLSHFWESQGLSTGIDKAELQLG